MKHFNHGEQKYYRLINYYSRFLYQIENNCLISQLKNNRPVYNLNSCFPSFNPVHLVPFFQFLRPVILRHTVVPLPASTCYFNKYAQRRGATVYRHF